MKRSIYGSLVVFYFLFCLIRFYREAVPSEGFSKNRIKTIEHTSLKFYLTNNRVWWRLLPTNGSNIFIINAFPFLAIRLLRYLFGRPFFTFNSFFAYPILPSGGATGLRGTFPGHPRPFHLTFTDIHNTYGKLMVAINK
jgi:hypothetical protein